jgi:hypothetical protein
MKRIIILVIGSLIVMNFAAAQEKGGIQNGKFGDVTVAYDNKNIKITNKAFGIILDVKRNLAIISLNNNQVSGMNLLANLSLGVVPDGQKSISEYYSQLIKSTPFTENAGNKFVLKIKQTWPFFNAVKTIEIYGNEPYIHLRYDIEISKDFQAKKIFLKLVSSEMTDVLCYPKESGIVFRKLLKKGKWFSFPKNNVKRWMAFYSEKKSAGFSIVGADTANWKEYRSRLLGVEIGSDGSGFGLELNVDNRTFRKGDKLYLDLFLYIFNEKPVENTSEFFNDLTGGN